MQTVNVQTTQNIDIDYEVAGLGDRVLARLIDLGFLIALFIIELVIALTTGSNKVVMLGLGIFFGVVFVFYDLAAEIIFNGQSAGKRIMKIKVISLNGGRPTISQYLLRWLFRIVDFSLTSGVCALICVAVSEKKQRVGDIVGGTTLIKTTPRTQFENLTYVIPNLDAYTPVFNNVIVLTDNDVALVHEVITNYNKTGNTVLLYNMAVRMKQHLSATTPLGMSDYEFLQTILKDYSYLTAAMA